MSSIPGAGTELPELEEAMNGGEDWDRRGMMKKIGKYYEDAGINLLLALNAALSVFLFDIFFFFNSVHFNKYKTKGPVSK